MTDDAESLDASYNAKDLILYALSIGMASCDRTIEREVAFVDESHKMFCAVPTFPLVLTFWATRQHQRWRDAGSSCSGIPPFPPPIMTTNGDISVIPRRFQREPMNLSKSPVLHISQSVEWMQPVPMPTKPADEMMRYDAAIHTKIRNETISVKPKSIGAFITTQTTLHQASTLLCRMQATALVGNVPKESVIAYDAGGKSSRSRAEKWKTDKEPMVRWKYTIPPNQSYLYRMASGDSNRIHVDGKQPIMHGLCTFGIAFRAFLTLDADMASKVKQMGARFAKPIYVNDEIEVKIWQSSTWRYHFVIDDIDTEERLVDDGYLVQWDGGDDGSNGKTAMNSKL